RVKKGGVLFSKWGLKRQAELKADHHFIYSLQNSAADVYASGITTRDGGYVFDVQTPGGRLQEVVLNMGGLHNIENAVAAIAIAKQLHIEDEKIKAAVADFKGVKRRFEY
ncbi:MAG TPA: Mur ligase family protein, partial [Agriterribacter sp.]|nr:Mur ligase family protein [Agriterribacter sp.]